MTAVPVAPEHRTVGSRRVRNDRERVQRVLGFSCLALSFTFVVGGCGTAQKPRMDNVGPAYVARNLGGSVQWPADVVRVAVLPAADATQTLPAEFTATYDQPWLDALQRSQRAEFVGIDRSTYARWTGTVRLPTSTQPLPSDWAARIQAATGADAVLLLDITRCSPYAPLSLGLRAKLIHLQTGEMIWAVDEFFDAAQPAVERAARHFAQAGQKGGQADAIAILQSPSRFARFASETVASSLPPR